MLDHIDTAITMKVNRYHLRYRSHLLGTLRFIDLKGLVTQGFYNPELDDVFVDVGLERRAPNQVPDSILADIPDEGSGRHSIDEFLDHEQPMVLVVIGAPGSGKTTLLRHTARQICRQRNRDRRRTVPILLYLRDHIDAITANPNVELGELLRQRLGTVGREEPPGWVEQRLNDGDCVILLDGLDEVAKQEDRQTMAEWVEHRTQQYPKNDFVITSRPQGYRSAPIGGAFVLQVQGFTSEQVTQFVHGWYRVVEQHSSGDESTEDVSLRAQTDADDLLSRLDDSSALFDLTVNPLLLTMIANVHRYRGALPGSRVELYSEICQVMLGRRQEAKHLPVKLNGERKESVLRGLALDMMLQQTRDMSRAEVLKVVNPALRRISTALTGEDFLADVSSNGLFIERDTDRYSFAHLTFQEYLAAMHIRDRGKVNILTESVDDVWWRETTLLYTARSVADPVVEACLASGAITALTLAFDIADSGDLAPQLRERLDAFLSSSDGDPARQRLRAAIRVIRFLRQIQIKSSTGNRICGIPVTNEIYQLFLTDSGASTVGHTDAAAESNVPVTGVWARDATAFVNWVNELTEAQPSYRLLTKAEVTEPAIQRALANTSTLSTWIHESHGLELWTPPGKNHPHEIDAETFIDQVRIDITRLIPTAYYLTLLQVRVLNVALAHTTDNARSYALTGALTHSLSRARALAHDVPRIRDITRDHAYALTLNVGLALDLARAHTIALNILNGDRHATISLTRLLDPALTGAFGLALNMDPDFILSFTLIRVHDLDRALDVALIRDRARHRDLTNLARDRELARGLILDRDLTLELARDRALELARDLTSARDLALELNRVLLSDTESGAMGGDFFSFLRNAMWPQPTKRQDIGSALEKIFANDRTIARSVISLDSMAEKMQLARTQSMNSTKWTRWLDELSYKLEECALPILMRQESINADAVAAIRLTTLCLAEELDNELYREVALGITLLERRANGQSPSTETLILATS